jgi:hypothetical protein
MIKELAQSTSETEMVSVPFLITQIAVKSLALISLSNNYAKPRRSLGANLRRLLVNQSAETKIPLWQLCEPQAKLPQEQETEVRSPQARRESSHETSEFRREENLSKIVSA